MMCKLIFNSDQDAGMRLNGSIVMYKDEPVYILDATRERCIVAGLDGGDKVVNTSDLDLRPVVIGNVQYNDYHVYIQRTPVRRWKQGLHRENIRVGKSHLALHHNVELRSVNVKNSIMGNFGKPMDNVRKVINGERESSALNRHWAVAKVKGVDQLMYKDNLVGFVSEGEVVINKKHFFLKEDLLEVLNG